MFREAEAGDFDDIVGRYEQLHPDDGTPTDGVGGGGVRAHPRPPGLRIYLLEEDGAVVATTYLNLIPNLTRGAAPYAVIENVVVEKTRRGKGFGKRIMDATLRVAWAEGCDKAMLMTAYLARPPPP